MNVPVEKSPQRADRIKRRHGVALALTLLSAGGLGACADIQRATSLPPVNPESPVAGVVTAAASKSYKRPTFQAVPPAPLNIPPADAVKTAVIDLVRCRRAYETWATSHPALVSGTGDFAKALRARLDSNPADSPTPAEQAASEAEAARLRAYAEPPPLIRSGPAPNASEAVPPAVVVSGASQHLGVVAPVKAAAKSLAATAPAATASSAADSAPAAAASPGIETVAAAQPSMTPAYADPVLARCQ